MSVTSRRVPLFGARRFATTALDELDFALRDRERVVTQLRNLGQLARWLSTNCIRGRPRPSRALRGPQNAQTYFLRAKEKLQRVVQRMIS
jgi:hypothetical protein